MRPALRSATALVFGLLSASCGGSGGDGVTEPGLPPVAAVASVRITPASTSILRGESMQLTATPQDGAGNALPGRTVTYTTSDAAVATVSGSGLVTGAALGSATITATSEGRAATATVTVTSPYLTARTVVAGDGYACALATSGDAWCWGYNYYGALGNGTQVDRVIPTPVLGGPYASLAAGGDHTCGVTAAGAAFCWGRTDVGQLGDDFTATRAGVPMPVVGGLTFASVAANTWHSCGITTAGAAWCWGDRAFGRLGDGTFGTGAMPRPVAVTGGIAFTRLALGEDHSCGLTSAGAAYCWGYAGSQGDGSSAGGRGVGPLRAGGGRTFIDLAAGQVHTCGLQADGEVYCWGGNDHGQLGDGTTTKALSPVLVSGGLAFASIDAGPTETCGLTRDGKAWCWGRNLGGEVGDGTTTERRVPTPVAGGLTFRSLAVGRGLVCGVATDSVAYCWGANTSGQVGDGTTTPRYTPMPVSLPSP